MKESYPDDIMLCFVQGFGEGERSYKPRELTEGEGTSRLSKKRYQKKLTLQVDNEDIGGSVAVRKPLTAEVIEEAIEFRSRNSNLVTGKSLRLSSGDRLLNRSPEVKRSFSDRFSVVTDANGKKPSKGLLTIRKTWSTGNFAASGAGGGCGAARSAPATPLQLDPRTTNTTTTKHDKHAVKPLSGSAPSVRESAVSGAASDSAGGGGSKQTSKARQKKFQRHFPQVGPEERVLNYYSCALVGDLLLQGHLYITKNYFAFYSNVFGYVTKLLIPITSVLRITKEKVARIIPNAVGVCTRDERHVFGSLLSRDSTYKLMTHVWKASRTPELATPKPTELRASEVELDASEYSPEDDSSSGGADHVDASAAPVKRDDAIISTAGAAVIQPALLTGGGAVRRAPTTGQAALIVLTVLLTASALLLAYRLAVHTSPEDDLLKLSGEELYSELVRWRTRLHGKTATELHSFLSTNLLLLTKVRQSLEALSGVMLSDTGPGAGAYHADPPNQTAFS